MGLREVSGKDPDYQFIELIGSGGFGTVTKVRRVKDGKSMACKSIDCSVHPELWKLASREIELWASFGSEKYIAAFSNDCTWNDSNRTIKLYMDYYEGGDLQRVIDVCQHEDTTIHPIVATYWAVEIARGIKACHDHGIIHRDIKPQNILLNVPYVSNDMLWTASNSPSQELSPEDQKLAHAFLEWMENRTPWCHLTDFGLGKFSTGAMLSRRTKASYGMIGTPGFIAPEAFGDDPHFSSKSDIYSLGCLLYTLCKCKNIPSMGAVDLGSISLPEHYPKNMQHIIRKCLESDPSARPSGREVLNELVEVFIDALLSKLWKKTNAVLTNEVTTQKAEVAPVGVDSIPSSLTNEEFLLQAKTIPSFLQEAGFRIFPYPQSKDRALLTVASHGTEEMIKWLVENAANINAWDERRYSALMIAIESSKFKNAELLLTLGIDTNIQGHNQNSAMFLSLRSPTNSESFVEKLIRHGAEVDVVDSTGFTPLTACLAEGKTWYHEVLIKNGANVNARAIEGFTPLMYASQRRYHEQTMTALLDHGADVNASNDHGQTALMMACLSSGHSEVRLLIQKGADVDMTDSEHRTALVLTIENDNLENFRALVQMKAHLTARMEHGSIPLHLAARLGRHEMVDYLLHHSVDPNMKDEHGSTALDIASSYNFVQVAQYLLKAGADMNLADDIGWTAAMRAASRGHLHMLSVLIDNGANINKTDILGWTALHVAVDKGYTEVVEMLLEAGADANATNEQGKTPGEYTTNSNIARILKRSPNHTLEFPGFY